MQQDDINIKGIRQGLLVSLGEGSWDAQLNILEHRLDIGASFFKGGRAALDVGERRLSSEQIVRVQGLLAQYGVELWAVLGTRDDTALAAARQGLAINLDLMDRIDRLEEALVSDDEPEAGTLLVERTLRSGQKVHHSGNVVIVGDVNAGAEVVAGGHVVVWGRLRGFVHAGVMGNEEAVVCALDLAPTQLRIADHFSRSPDESRHRPVPEMARVQDGQIEAVPWQEE